MAEIQLFEFPATGARVRTLNIDNEPWFVAADVCAALGIGRTHDAVRGLDDDEKGAETIRTPGGDQCVSIVNESGLYSLILRSRKPDARAFKRWVTHEVLPAIRRTGSYMPTMQIGDLDTITRVHEALGQALAIARQEKDRADHAEAYAAELEAPAQAWDTLASGDGDYSVSDAAKILSRDPAIQLGGRRLFTVLAELKWIFRQGSDGRWRAYQAAIDSRRLSELPQSHYHQRTGALVLDPPQVRITVKGLQKLHRLLGGSQLLQLNEPQLELPEGRS